MIKRYKNILIGVAVVLLAYGAKGADVQSRPGSCGCNDAADLYARYCSGRTAIQEWNRLINKTREEERKGEKVVMSSGQKDEVANCVDEAINIQYQLIEAATPGMQGQGNLKLKKAGGTTDNSCNVEIKAPTACLSDVIARHESWHKRTCEAHFKPDAAWRATANPFSYLAGMFTWLSDFSLVDYMYEERTGYMLELNYTRSRLEELSERCPLQSIFPNDQGKRGFTLKACPVMKPEDWNRTCKRM